MTHNQHHSLFYSVVRLFPFFIAICSEIKKDEKYKVIRIFPENEDHLAILAALYKNSTDYQLDFWKTPKRVGEFADVMSGPMATQPLIELLIRNNMKHIITISDVEKLIIERESRENDNAQLSMNNPLESFIRRLKDYSSSNRAKLSLNEYHSYNEISQWLEDIQFHYPRIAAIFTIGITHEGRPIKGIKIGYPIHATNKRIIWIDGGVHAREWAAIQTALYFIDQLVSKYGSDPQITAYIDALNFYIIPVVNPDGFEYSRSDIVPPVRFWRKNRGTQVCKKDRWKRERCCGGVDLNRNFDFHWGESGSSTDICSDIYQGSTAFSESETRAIRDKMFSPELYGKVDAFITLHTYSQMWLHPYSHQKHTFPDDVEDLKSVAKRGIRTLESLYGTKYRLGTGADILYPSAGGSDDWAKAKAKVKYVYLLELRPGEDEWDGFLLDRKQLIPTGRETWEGVKVVIDTVLKQHEATTPRSVIVDRRHLVNSNSQQKKKPLRGTESENFVTRRPPKLISRNFYQPISENLNNQQLRINHYRRLELLRARQNALIKDFQQRLGTSATCRDASPWCHNWIRSSPNICKTSIIYMRQDCFKSCDYCV